LTQNTTTVTGLGDKSVHTLHVVYKTARTTMQETQTDSPRGWEDPFVRLLTASWSSEYIADLRQWLCF